ncbi:MAG: hypothetical protein ACI9MC_000571 [Kiritimatiellia bacterium]
MIALGDVEGIPQSEILPARYPTRANMRKVVAKLQESYSRGTGYQTCVSVVSDLWPWASDRNIPGVGDRAARQDNGGADAGDWAEARPGQLHLWRSLRSGGGDPDGGEGLARAGVWQPTNRKKGNPTHTLRARCMAPTRERAVQDYVIDYLVGHSPRRARDVSYAWPPLSIQRLAVGTFEEPK